LEAIDTPRGYVRPTEVKEEDTVGVGGDDFAQRFGRMELDMPEFLLTLRGNLPRTLIKPLRIPPGLRVE
jgi:hypothetical protein